MSQEDVRQILEDLGGQATVQEISVEAKEKFPDRSLHTYVGLLLQRLKNKGFVSKPEDSDWKLTEKGETTSIKGVELPEVDQEVDHSTLNKHGLTIANIVGTIQTNRELDLNALADDLSEAEYHPESSPFLIYRPIESATLLVPTNGLISIVGAKTLEQTKEAAQSFFKELRKLDININIPPSDILIQNIVASGDLGVELELNTLSLSIGLERCEYNPEQFPGLIFRNDRGSTILIFRTGKYLINGCKSYSQVVSSNNALRRELQELGIDLEQ